MLSIRVADEWVILVGFVIVGMMLATRYIYLAGHLTVYMNQSYIIKKINIVWIMLHLNLECGVSRQQL